MLKGLWKLTWVEIKVFMREPMGVVGSVGLPVIIFLLLGRAGGSAAAGPDSLVQPVILASLFVALSAVTSLTAIIAIYREGGILKRLRATALRPVTILGAHVIVKLLLTALAFGILFLPASAITPARSVRTR